MAHRIRTFAAGAAVGAGIAYFYDPRLGAGRRNRVVDMASARMRRASRQLERESRYREGQLAGAAYRSEHLGLADADVDDNTLRDRIESEVFGGDFPKSDVTITVVDAVVEIRGQLHHPEEIRDVVKRVAAVPGVVDVRSYLHLPNTPAPNKRESREAG